MQNEFSERVAKDCKSSNPRDSGFIEVPDYKSDPAFPVYSNYSRGLHIRANDDRVQAGTPADFDCPYGMLK